MKTRAGARTIEAPDWLIAMLRGLKERTPFGEPTDYVFLAAARRREPRFTDRPRGRS